MHESSARRVLVVAGHEELFLSYSHLLEKNRLTFDFALDGGRTLRHPRNLAHRGQVIPLPNFKTHKIAWAYALRRLAKRGSWDFIHINMNWWSFLPIIALLGLEISPIVHSHSVFPESTGAKSHFEKIIEFVFRSKKIKRVACSYRAGARLFGDSPFTVLPNFVRPELFVFRDEERNLVRASLSLPENAFVIGHVGSISAIKNQVFLLEILDTIIVSEPNTFLLLVGHGPDRDKVVQLAIEQGLASKLRIVGHVDNPSPYLAAMDVFAMPSRFEGVPVALLEAVVNGLPVVASDSFELDPPIQSAAVSQLSLELGKSRWAEEILSVAKVQDRETSAPIMEEAQSRVRLSYVSLLNLYEIPNSELISLTD